MNHTAVTRYHPLLRVLHWVIAVLIILQLAVGFLALADVPNDVDKIFPLTGHVSVGIAIGALMLIRLIVRFTTPRPPPAPAGNVAFDGLRRLTHFLFYVVVLAMVSTGVGLAFLSNLFPILFGAGGPLPASFEEFPPRAGHDLFANVLIGLLALHVAGGLYHHFVLRDGLFSRMWFGAGGKAREAGPDTRP